MLDSILILFFIILYKLHGDKIPVVCVVVTTHLGVVVDAGTL